MEYKIGDYVTLKASPFSEHHVEPTSMCPYKDNSVVKVLSQVEAALQQSARLAGKEPGLHEA